MMINNSIELMLLERLERQGTMQYDIIGSKNKLITKCKQKHNNDVV